MIPQASSIFAIAKAEISKTIQQLLKEVGPVKFVGSAQAANDLARINKLNPDLILIHHNPPNFDAVKIIEEIRIARANARFLVLLSEEKQFWSVIQSKADGYVVFPTTWLPSAINTIVQGGVWLGPVITDFLLRGRGMNVLENAAASIASPPTALDTLSNREREVLRLLLDGLKNHQIADALGLSVGTVKVHVKHLLEKLQLSGRGQAIVKLASLKAVI